MKNSNKELLDVLPITETNIDEFTIDYIYDILIKIYKIKGKFPDKILLRDDLYKKYINMLLGDVNIKTLNFNGIPVEVYRNRKEQYYEE